MEEEEEREGKSFKEVEHHEEVETTICQIENRDTEVKVGAVGRIISFQTNVF